MILILFSEGNNYRRTARILSKMFDKNISYQLMVHWVKNKATQLLINTSKVKHLVLKSETCLVESFNVKMRHYIPCLAHKAKAYVKSRESLNKVMKFLCLERKFVNEFVGWCRN